MNPRERLLAIVVGVLAIGIAGYFVQSWVGGRFAERRAKIARLEGEIKSFKRQVAAGQKAVQKLAAYEERSLPANPEIARTQYQNWLLDEVERAGLSEPEVAFGSLTQEKNLYDKQSFTVAAKGMLPQVVDLLHTFYSVDWLHRITRLTLVPVKDSKQLEVHLTVEALSLRRANIHELAPRPSRRLTLAHRQAYHDAIVGRNLFGPANNAPRITAIGNKDVPLGRSTDLTVKGTDPDPLDKVRYRLVQSPDPEAKLDPDSGRLSWSPKALGKYEFVVEAIDDGLPNKASRPEKIVLNVIDAPGPVAKRLDFDHAKYTVLTAVLDVDGQGEIWLHIRPTGQTLALHEGDQFEVGSVKGTVTEIGLYDFSFVSDGKRRKLAQGDILEQAQVIGDAGQPTSVTPAAPEVQAKLSSDPAS
jgi:hypothetical protein